MGNVTPINGEDKIANHPKVINQEQKITLLVTLVERQAKRLDTIEERLKHIIDQNDRIIAALLPGA